MQRFVSSKMKQARTRELYAYWESLRGDSPAAARADVDPIAIRGLLNDAFMLSCQANEGYAVRLAGGRINELFLTELKDLPFAGLFHVEDRASLMAMIAGVLDDPSPTVAGVRAAPPGREPMDMELLLLPLGPLHTPKARILGSLVATDRPAWAGLLACAPMRLTSLRVLNPALARKAGAMSLNPALWSTLPLRDAVSARKLPLRSPHITLYNG